VRIHTDLECLEVSERGNTMNDFVVGFRYGFKRSIWLSIALPVAVIAAIVRTVVAVCFEDDGPFETPNKEPHG
jgi:hypothetical protein